MNGQLWKKFKSSAENKVKSINPHFHLKKNKILIVQIRFAIASLKKYELREDVQLKLNFRNLCVLNVLLAKRFETSSEELK